MGLYSDSMEYIDGILPSGVVKHGWKIPELNGGFYRKSTDKWSSFHYHV